MQEWFKGIFDSEGVSAIQVGDFLSCVICGLICGVILSLCYMVKTRYTRGFVATLAMLPSIVAVVIMMVNGNLGAGVAVAGAFSLVRFRSAPGNAKEISAIFVAMGVGLIVGMGYLGYALLVSGIFGFISIFYNVIGIKMGKHQKYKSLRITIPEDLDYTNVFESLFEEYTSEYELVKVKSTNMGSMFRLTYNIALKKDANEKELIDKIRCRNGNLEISVSRQETGVVEL